MLLGLGLFALASIAAERAASPTSSFAARALMGIGGAIIIPVGFAVLPSLFSQAQPARVVSLIVMGTALGLPLGPLLGLAPRPVSGGAQDLPNQRADGCAGDRHHRGTAA